MDSTTKHNHGTAKSDNIQIPYGKDSSEMTGPASKERIPSNMGGSVENLSHTLSSGSAKQRQR